MGAKLQSLVFPKQHIHMPCLMIFNQMTLFMLVSLGRRQGRHSTVLIAAEHELAKLQNLEQQQALSIKERDLEITVLQTKVEALETAFAAINNDRHTILAAAIANKEQLIESLRNELQSTNQQYLAEIRAINASNHDKLMQEKIVNINLQEKINQLQKKIASLENNMVFP